MSVARGGQRPTLPLRREKMVYQPRITNATCRTALVLVFLCVFGINVFAADDTEGIIPGDLPSVAATEPAAQQKPSPSPTPSAAMSPASDKVVQSQQGRSMASRALS